MTKARTNAKGHITKTLDLDAELVERFQALADEAGMSFVRFLEFYMWMGVNQLDTAEAVDKVYRELEEEFGEEPKPGQLREGFKRFVDTVGTEANLKGHEMVGYLRGHNPATARTFKEYHRYFLDASLVSASDAYGKEWAAHAERAIQAKEKKERSAQANPEE